MITKGIIISIDYSGNTCMVRLPIFEGAGNQTEVVLPAIISCAPGSLNPFKINDVVIVGFEEYLFDRPIILGKLYLGRTAETPAEYTPGGGQYLESLTVTNNASIPITTQLNYIIPNQTAIPAGGVSEFNTLLEALEALTNLQKQVAEQQEQLHSQQQAIEQLQNSLQKD